MVEALGLPAPPFTRMGQISAGQLIALVSRVWDQRDDLGARIRARVPELVRRARINHSVALELLGAGRHTAGARVAPS